MTIRQTDRPNSTSPSVAVGRIYDLAIAAMRPNNAGLVYVHNLCRAIISAVCLGLKLATYRLSFIAFVFLCIYASRIIVILLLIENGCVTVCSSDGLTSECRMYREWMQLVSQEILNPSYGLFLYADDDCNTVRLNPDSGINPVHRQ